MDHDDQHEFCGTECEFCGEQIADGAPVHHGWTKGTPETGWPTWYEATQPREMQWCDRCDSRDETSGLRHVVTTTQRCACQPCQAARLERDLRASLRVERGSPLLSSVALLLRPEVVS